ncbi:MAG: flagellar hook-associated protein FlgL [Acidimicrobiales bacterium]|nr:flagellar hook-associated protein FlgL [Acidimicrobiales bacterium]
MRVTPTTLHQTALEGLQSSISRVQKNQAELASGKRINNYSDAPADASSTLRLRAEETDWVSYAKAADDGVAWLKTQDSALQDASTLLRRARELTLSAAQSTNSAIEREGIATELDGIKNQLAALANTSYQGQKVFAGFAANAVVNVAGNWTWAGDANAVQRRVSPELLVQVNGDGSSIFGFGSGTNVFATIATIADHVRNANIGALGTSDLGLLDAAEANIAHGLASTGARTNLIESAKTTGSAQIAVLKDTRSSIEDVDVAEAALNMKLAESGYQAALAAAARLSLPSLVDFLR